MTGEELFKRAICPDHLTMEEIKNYVLKTRQESETEFLEILSQTVSALREYRANNERFEREFLDKYGVSAADELNSRPASDPYRQKWEEQRSWFDALSATAEAVFPGLSAII